MEDGKPSETAHMVAAMRAHHFYTASEPRILDDHLAGPLAGFQNAEDVASYLANITDRFAAIGDREAAEAMVAEITQGICMRSRLVEEQLAIVRERDLSQVVVLGAGMDSLAFRRLDLTRGLKVFEVDHPATQAWKRAALATIGTEIPDNVTFVAFDFEHQTLAQALAEGGVDTTAITFFSWLGVQPYLTEETVMATLAVLGAFPRGSQLVMDLIPPVDEAADENVSDGFRQLLAVIASMGEPFRSRFTEDAFMARLRQCGFSHASFDYPTEGSAALARYQSWSPHMVPIREGFAARFVTAEVAA